MSPLTWLKLLTFIKNSSNKLVKKKKIGRIILVLAGEAVKFWGNVEDCFKKKHLKKFSFKLRDKGSITTPLR